VNPQDCSPGAQTAAGHIRSFVRREGRITAAQRRALRDLWPRFAVVDLAKLRDLPALFQRTAPCCIEVGCGDGQVLTTLARQNPDCDFIGIDVYRSGLGRLLRRLAEAELGNVRVIASDATEVMSTLAAASIDELFVFFPDPWPKRRHWKRRLLQDPFFPRARRVLRGGGRLHIATDWRDYAESISAAAARSDGFLNAAGASAFAPRPCRRPVSRYEARAHRLGMPVFELVLVAI
jgi:tRNA (guanine-N7-)-methyltransferase